MTGVDTPRLQWTVESGSVEKREQRTMGCVCEVSVVHLDLRTEPGIKDGTWNFGFLLEAVKDVLVKDQRQRLQIP